MKNARGVVGCLTVITTSPGPPPPRMRLFTRYHPSHMPRHAHRLSPCQPIAMPTLSASTASLTGVCHKDIDVSTILYQYLHVLLHAMPTTPDDEHEQTQPIHSRHLRDCSRFYQPQPCRSLRQDLSAQLCPTLPRLNAPVHVLELNIESFSWHPRCQSHHFSTTSASLGYDDDPFQVPFLSPGR
jgi:hypothetical protein